MFLSFLIVLQLFIFVIIFNSFPGMMMCFGVARAKTGSQEMRPRILRCSRHPAREAVAKSLGLELGQYWAENDGRCELLSIFQNYANKSEVV